MGTEAVRKGPIAERVAESVRTHRTRRGLSHRQMSARMREVGHPILPSGIARIEDGTRRVDVDDLVALALALRVPLAVLLLPGAPTGEPVNLTENVPVDFTAAWRWVRGELLPDVAPEPDDDGDGWVKLPSPLRDFIEGGHPDLFAMGAIPVDTYQMRLSAVVGARVAEIENVRFRGPKPDQNTEV